MGRAAGWARGPGRPGLRPPASSAPPSPAFLGLSTFAPASREQGAGHGFPGAQPHGVMAPLCAYSLGKPGRER